ncbi:MAG: dynamin family protein [Planctomycetes bacterium]|nr:dynamin family protein [Planctomycetota bacterium]
MATQQPQDDNTPLTDALEKLAESLPAAEDEQALEDFRDRGNLPAARPAANDAEDAAPGDPADDAPRPAGDAPRPAGEDAATGGPDDGAAPAASAADGAAPAVGDAAPSDPAGHAMRTRLREFAERFDAEFRPVIAPIERAVETVAVVSEQWRMGSILPGLRELAHQVRVLVEKVSGQQSYVLIFGPLKSGKSTFMNAACGAYVSEVTSLPAYPCIVSVSHGSAPCFTVTRYDGSRSELTDPRDLQELVRRAQVELAGRIRQVEAEGEDFDPQRHMPQAIRRIDVRLPAGDLAASGAVLVDTPGLYSRMKFGYDQMTRDFRNTAACAVFVVKTDNLFLEQVFDEFNELLELFSRVFVIVNVDSTKMDLAPDGRLVPSLEQRDCGRIIQAFRDFSLTAPLKAADDAGRLRIYPVDLLRAASTRIRRKHAGGGPAETQATGPATGGGEDASAGFDVLLQELTDYLNSSEYLREFLADSLRRAESLFGQLAQLAGHPRVRQLKVELADLHGCRRHTAGQLEALGRLEAVDLPARSLELRRQVERALRDKAAERRQAAAGLIKDEIGQWFQTSASFRQLLDESVGPLIARARDECVRFCKDELDRQAGGGAAGLNLSEETLADLRLAEVDLEEPAAAALAGRLAGEPQSLSDAFGTSDIPVRRSLWDWLLLRSRAKVRRRLFGPPDSPDLPIPPEVKARRLGQAGRQAMQSLAEAHLQKLLDDLWRQLPKKLVGQYVDTLASAVRDLLDRRRAELSDRLADLRQRCEEGERILDDLRRLAERMGQAGRSVQAVRAEFTGQPDSREPVAELTAAPADVPADAAETPAGDRLANAAGDGGAEARQASTPGGLEVAGAYVSETPGLPSGQDDGRSAPAPASRDGRDDSAGADRAGEGLAGEDRTGPSD